MYEETFALAPHALAGIELRPMDGEAAVALGRELAAIPPWSTINYPATALIDALTRRDDALRRFAIVSQGGVAGVLAVRWPWLKGPYLELLGVTPPFQGRGLGAAALGWMEGEARRTSARWMWLLASSFNTRALAFYERRGFARVAALDDLAVDGFTEFLMRKRLPPRPAAPGGAEAERR